MSLKGAWRNIVQRVKGGRPLDLGVPEPSPELEMNPAEAFRRLAAVDPELQEFARKAELVLHTTVAKWRQTCNGCQCESCVGLRGAWHQYVQVQADILAAAQIPMETLQAVSQGAWDWDNRLVKAEAEQKREEAEAA